MSRLVLLAAAMAACASTATAEVVFHGALTITKVSPQCQNVQKGWSWPSRFHPLVPGQEGKFEGLNIMFDFGGAGYRMEKGKFPSKPAFKPAESGGLGWGGVFIRPKAEWTRFAGVSYTNPSKPTLTLKGKAQRWDNDPGGFACEVSFVGSYVKVDD